MTLLQILLLYLAFRVKQVVCDFFLQTSWMALTKGTRKKGGTRALGLHAAIHAGGTFVVTILCAPAFWWLAVVDFLVHALIDKVRAVINEKCQWTYKDKHYWWAFGIDQEAHNLTHLCYIILIVRAVGGLCR